MPDSWVKECRFDNGFDDAFYAIKEIFSNRLESIPTGIIAENDDMAAGAYKALEKLSLSIPEDVSVIGCDNAFFSRYLSPSLTTIEQYGYSIGKRASEFILTGDKSKLGEHRFDIIERESISNRFL